MTIRVLMPEEVHELLGELVRRLASRGCEGSVHVIGGAAIALINPERVATQDIDGFMRLEDATDVVAELAREYDLAPDWFNWRAQGLQPPIAGSEMWREVLRVGTVVLYSATTEALLAMKLNAARARDSADIAWLLASLGIVEFEEAERVFEDHYPGDTLSTAAEERLRFALDQNAGRAQVGGSASLARALNEIDEFYGGAPAPASDAIKGMYEGDG